MFKDLLFFEKVRTKKEALGFYLAYLLLIILLSSLRGFFSPTGSSEEAFQRGAFGAVISCLVLSFLVLYKKKLLNQFGLLLIAVLSGVAAIFGGALIGLPFVAYLTTRENKAISQES